ncbi:DUF350 domain-containing protein [candidate division TA06 bacterium]|nr:DUF350 domain-containing protein [candidate division TA06 bacterium]
MEKMISEEIKKLVPILGRENASRLTKAYLLADEDTKQRIFELVDVIKAGVFADKDLRNAALREPPSLEDSKGDIEIGYALYGRKRMHPFSLKKELAEDDNIAVGVLLGSVVIGLSIIIASAIGA